MSRKLTLLTATLVLAACGGEQVDTVSGVSSGAYMAGQLHVAYSDVFSGAGMIAGGPYGCAQDDLATALGPCLKGGEIDVVALLEQARAAEADNRIAPLANLTGDTAWLFHSPADPVVSPDTTAASITFYESVGSTVVAVNDVAVIHGFPTLDAGVACDKFETPYVNACGYDAAGMLLSALGASADPAETAGGTLETIPVSGAGEAELLDYAYLYVPTSCAEGNACGVHVALHGCQQSAEVVDDAFATLTGYNRWADSNDLLVLYPQVESSAMAPLNPNGCWDWWGYTGDDYATRSASQMKVIVDLVNALAVAE